MSCINFDVRLCEDGALVYNLATRTTHLIPTPVWEFFMALTEARASAIAGELDHTCMLYPEQEKHEEMIKALVRAGLLASC